MPDELHIDVLIFGGGIAGLWTLARLTRAGYSCLLLEAVALGAEQTIGSQGIIHGGVKYALGGEATDASRAIAEMPGIWLSCLRGEGEVDLRSVDILSQHQYLWTTPGLFSRVAGFGASRSIRAGVEKVEGDTRPELFRTAPRGVDVYRVDEPVLDTRKVVESIAQPLADRTRRVDPGRVSFRDADSSGVRVIEVDGADGRTVLFRLKSVVFAAGRGNESLLAMSKLDHGLLFQTRPLHMVMAKKAPGPLFGHCLGASSLPRLTITSARSSDEDGSWVWYIGGAIAEAEGVARDEAAQIAYTRSEVAECLPWLDLSHLRFASCRWDRAEGMLAASVTSRSGKRPDGPTVSASGNVITAWPTKLAFAPLMAERVFEHIASLIPRTESAPAPVNSGLSLADLPRASIAPRPWEGRAAARGSTVITEEVRWT